MDVSLMRQLSAMAASVANSTTCLLSTGRAPGMPRQTGQTFVFGGAPKRVEQEQKILLAVSSWTCTSRPMTGSYFARPATELSAAMVISRDYSEGRSQIGITASRRERLRISPVKLRNTSTRRLSRRALRSDKSAPPPAAWESQKRRRIRIQLACYEVRQPWRQIARFEFRRWFSSPLTL